MRIHINRATITKAISLYILSWIGVLFFIYSMKQHLGGNFQPAALYMIVSVYYMPLNVFAMFLIDTPAEITIPGLISMIFWGYILLGYVDFTVNLGD